MKLTGYPLMKSTAHGHGNRGMEFYTFEDDLGVLLDHRRASSRHSFVQTYRFRWLPNREFFRFTALREALEVTPDSAIAAEKARWPQLVKAPIPRGVSTSICWLHSDRPATHTATVQLSWYKYDVKTAVLCVDCAATADAALVAKAANQRAEYCATKSHG